MKLFGHPIHLLLIHFPSALFPMDVICSICAILYHRPGFSEAAVYAEFGGVVIGWLAALAGIADVAGVMKHKPQALNRALIHGAVNAAVLTGFTVFSII